MVDPLSIAAGVVGVTAPALHGTRLLLDDIRRIKDAPKTLRDLEGDVHSFEVILLALQAIEDRGWEVLSTHVAEQSKIIVGDCTVACHHFRTSLQRWTKHSGSQLAWQDRAKVGFFKQGQIEAISEQLQHCKLTINSVISVANLYVSIRNHSSTEEVRNAVLTEQAEVNGNMTTVGERRIVLEKKLEDIDVDGTRLGEDVDTDGKKEALEQLQEERKALDTSRTLLDGLLLRLGEEQVSKTVSDHHTHQTNVRFGNNNKGFQAATVNGAISGMQFGMK